MDPDDPEHDQCRALMEARSLIAALRKQESDIIEKLERMVERVGTLEVMAEEAVRERNERLYDVERQRELRRQTESKCDSLRRQLQDEKAKLSAVMDNVAEMMAQAQAWENATASIVKRGIADGQRRSIRGCAHVCESMAEEHDDPDAQLALTQAAGKILALLESDEDT